MELRKSLDFRKVLATICFLVATFCFARGLNTADAVSYEISVELSAPSIGLEAGVTKLQLEDRTLKTPDTIVGSFSRFSHKTLLIGHAATVFSNLKNLKIGDEIDYDYNVYVVKNIEMLEKTSINMDALLAPTDTDTIILMTCAGELYENGDASHRLIITATSE